MMTKSILIIDDDNLVCLSLKRVLTRLGFEFEICMNAGEANDYIKNFDPKVILLDIYLTTHNGMDLLKEFRKKYPDLPIIMITGYSDVKNAVSALKMGAYDFLLKPLDLEQLKSVLNKVFDNLNLRNEVNKLNTLFKSDIITEEYFGQSHKIQKILNTVKKLAFSTDTTVLIEGESGTGKEGFAKFIHQNSPRISAPFIQINCSAIPKELAESEFFGHEKGAFTGAALKTKMGKFELANGGTILLDEIGDLSLDLQAKLLRVLQEKKFYRVGGEKEVSVDIRIIAATNKNLELEITKGNFREDLFYRLNVAKIYLPQLKDRTEDIPYLSYIFLKEFNQKLNKNINEISPEALQLLISYSWRGNIRELRNTIERAMLLAETEVLNENSFSFLPVPTSGAESGSHFSLEVPPKGVKMEFVIKELIQKTLIITKGNQLKAAKVLGISRAKLRYRMEQLGIEVIKQIQ
jgi:DNA-binding NtrC family response regulator